MESIAAPTRTAPESTRPADSPEALRAEEGASGFFDEVDRRLMDTFPASDAVARY